jgi:hypothetical protein
MHTGKIAATAAAAVALAALVGQMMPAAADQSDSNMAYVSRYIESAASALNSDRNDYAGHKVAALADIARARTDIANALAYDSSHDRFNYSAAARANAVDVATFQRTQAGSDRSLTFVRTNLLNALDMLSRDKPEYNGWRLRAISDLQAARNQITMALQQNVSAQQPGVASDSNIRYTRAYIQRGIGMLDADRSDYAGHRVAAIRAMQIADADLVDALRADRADESIPSVQALAVPAGYMNSQRASNQNIAYARTYVEHAMDMLQNDQHDYNGYRAKAVQQLAVARAQLLDALQSR